MNRAERRRAERAQGYRGSKAKRTRKGGAQTADDAYTRIKQAAEQQKVEKIIESAQGIRRMSGGQFWLPGDE